MRVTMGNEDADRIDIVGLEVSTIIGIFGWERKRRQRVLLDLSLHADIRHAARSDAIDDALDYKRVTKRVIAVVRKARFFLLERLAEEVARVLLEEFGVRRVTVRAEKPGALRHARTVAVTVTRTRAPVGTRRRTPAGTRRRSATAKRPRGR